MNMKAIKFGLLALIALVGIAFVTPSYAQATPADKALEGWRQAGGDTAGDTNLSVRVKDVVNIILYVLGVVAVIMIIIGGFRYVVSGGDSSAVTGAKNTILYAVIGLIVAILAYAIVNFVIKSIG